MKIYKLEIPDNWANCIEYFYVYPSNDDILKSKAFLEYCDGNNLNKDGVLTVEYSDQFSTTYKFIPDNDENGFLFDVIEVEVTDNAKD